MMDPQKSGDEGREDQRSESADRHVSQGTVLWTLTRGNATAQGRCWVTARGFELEMHIWNGPRVEGQEDLCWTQLFASEETLTEVALSKKRQLEGSGWLEDIETSGR